MGNENGTWIMHGMNADDPECIHTVDELATYIEKVGFLPLFKNNTDGFSVEEHTESGYWWSGDISHDPWEWRAIIARDYDIAYGKFFDKKAGFISKKWFPVFANARRDGYDFDSLWEEGKAKYKSKLIMDNFLIKNELYSNELKELSGFGKGGEKNFDGILTELQMSTYLCVRDFRQRLNKKNQPYGWAIAIYTTPEHMWGYDFVTSEYSTPPEQSKLQIMQHMKQLYKK